MLDAVKTELRGGPDVRLLIMNPPSTRTDRAAVLHLHGDRELCQ